MFSGIIEELGKVTGISQNGRCKTFAISSVKFNRDVKLGDSIAVNGVCLTVASKRLDALLFDVMPETLQVTTLGLLKTGDQVNLERSLLVGDRISGHFVLGHVDCMGLVRRRSYVKDNLCFQIAVPVVFMKYIVAKGSVAIDGISLTVAGRSSNTFSVYVIPHTLKTTTLNYRQSSSKVNVEFDILMKRPQ